MKKSRRLRTASGDPIPTMAELRQVSAACDRFLRARGEHVGGYAENIQREANHRKARKTKN